MSFNSINNKYNYSKKFKIVKVAPYLLMLSLALNCDIKAEAKNDTIVENKEITQCYNNANSEEFYLDDEYAGMKERKLVAFTFDDGPGKYTERLVSALNFNGVSATFFLIGSNINNYSDAVIKAYTSGNEIAIHTYSHKSFTKMTIKEIQEELDLTNELLENLDVTSSNLVRPPYGSINDKIQESIDTSFIIWSVDTRDWESRDKDKVKEMVLENISEGDIVLFHDIHLSTVEAIEELLPDLVEDYEIVSVSELFKRKSIDLEEHKKYTKAIEK